MDHNDTENTVDETVHFKTVKKQASELLSTREIRLKTVLMLVTAITLSVGFYVVMALPGNALYTWLYDTYHQLLATLVVLLDDVLIIGAALLLLAPLLTGVICYACRTAQGEETDMTALFTPLSSVETYGRVCLYLLGNLWRWLLSLLTPVALVEGTILYCKYIQPQIDSGTKLGLFVGCGILAALALMVALYLCGDTFLTPCLIWTRPDLSVPECRRLSRERMKGNRMRAWTFHICFLGYACLSLLTMGILLLLHVMPMWLYSYVYMAQQLLKNRESEPAHEDPDMTLKQ